MKLRGGIRRVDVPLGVFPSATSRSRFGIGSVAAMHISASTLTPLSRRMTVVASAILVMVSLAGCSGSPSTPAPDTTLTDDGVPADTTGTPRDAAIAATCATVSAATTTLSNARVDRESGAISDDQYAALVNSSATVFQSLLVVNESQRGLRAEIQAVADFLDKNPLTSPSEARFEYGDEFGALLVPVREHCATNLSELVNYATSGG